MMNKISLLYINKMLIKHRLMFSFMNPYLNS